MRFKIQARKSITNEGGRMGCRSGLEGLALGRRIATSSNETKRTGMCVQG